MPARLGLCWGMSDSLGIVGADVAKKGDLQGFRDEVHVKKENCEEMLKVSDVLVMFHSFLRRFLWTRRFELFDSCSHRLRHLLLQLLDG